ncbi:restriction endonuclease [Pseudoxanthomonas winnipegensis]|uniref:restriction endonuclease n=1 Tax=Pseudoxanthomonas winnipegensis TaxID=2480810 RepID=UPI001039325A|nr:restriction endonuclease [Pseudoxanthomonas winnipegensis]TBV69779.1 restriction endonuclease [Pseudoxanthomonas winnipegensis]
MARKRNTAVQFPAMFIAVAFLVLAVVWAVLSRLPGWVLFLGVIVVVGCGVALGIALVLYLAHRRRHPYVNLTLSQIDALPGHQFEHYVAGLLGTQGFYDIQVTKGSGDSGIDIVATQAGVRHAIQVKRSGSPVSRRAVSDAVAGLAHYRCTRAMVITNHYFSPGAKSLAVSNQCFLIDRDILARWIQQRQQPTPTLDHQP